MPEVSTPDPTTPPPARDASYSSGPIVLVLAILLAISAVQKLNPPASVSRATSPREFSARRALHDLRAIAAAPHAVGSDQQVRVREYLLKRLAELGATPKIESATVASADRNHRVIFATVYNLVGRIPGSASTGTVLMVAHYDSVPSGPGAGDDSAAVATLLETVRALKSAPPLRNDVIVLLTDGEELGMLGARAFVENSPELHDVKIVLNFEMRGDYGPVVMFQTSNPNGWLIKALAATPSPRAGSLFPALYKLLPNDTDLTEFLRAGKPGMNFAAIGGLSRYHTRLDNLTNLSVLSLQHQGVSALALAREFGMADLSKPARGDSIYFPVYGVFVRYPAGLAIPLAIIGTLILLGAITVEIRRARMRATAILGGAGIFIVTTIVVVVESLVIHAIFARAEARVMLPFGSTYSGAIAVAAAIVWLFATLCAIYLLLARYIARANLAAGALIVFAILALVSAAIFPGGSYLITWPLIFAAVALSFRWRGEPTRDPIPAICATLIAAIVCAVILAPSFVPTADGTPLMFALGAIVVALIFGVAIPYTEILSGGHERILIGALVVAGVVLFAVAGRQARFGPKQPRPDSIFYILDTNTGRATWASVDRAPDPWTAQFFQSHVRGGSLSILTGEATASNGDPAGAPRSRFCWVNRGRTIEGDAPPYEFAAPIMRVLSDSTINHVRTVVMHIASDRDAPIVWVTIARGVTVKDSSVDGKSPGTNASDGYAAWYWNAPKGGFDLTLKLTQPGPIRVNVIDQTYGLPRLPGVPVTARPRDVMPTMGLFFDSATLVRKTFIVGGLPPTPNA